MGETDHISLDGLAARVTATERQIAAVAEQVGNLARETTAQNTNLGNRFTAELNAIGAKIDRQNENFGASRATNWQSLAAIAGVLLSIGGIVVSQLNSNISRNDVAIGVIESERFTHRDGVEMAAGFTHWIDKVQTDKVGREEYAEALSDLKQRVAAIEGMIVKRPEIEAAQHAMDQRIDALSTRDNGIQAQIDSFFPAAKTIDEMWAQIRESRSPMTIAPQKGP